MVFFIWMGVPFYTGNITPTTSAIGALSPLQCWAFSPATPSKLVTLVLECTRGDCAVRNKFFIEFLHSQICCEGKLPRAMSSRGSWVLEWGNLDFFFCSFSFPLLYHNDLICKTGTKTLAHLCKACWGQQTEIGVETQLTGWCSPSTWGAAFPNSSIPV